MKSCAASAAVDARLRSSLLSLLSGDALASPTHWFYGGSSQVLSVYGGPITGFTAPVERLSGSIMGKSNVNGGGRGRFGKDPTTGKAIIGDVINHGKYKYWDPRESYHYHATLKAGENTLEGSLVRLLMRTVTNDGGEVSAPSFRAAYLKFMQTPDSHNDAYASTCHRMFFANYVRGKDAADCPDNDGHNVDTVDGLILPAVAAMAASASGVDLEESRRAATDIGRVTRRSKVLDRWASAWAALAHDALHSESDDAVLDAARKFTGDVGLRPPDPRRGADVAACYLTQSVPGLMNAVARWTPVEDVRGALLENSNAGGENVHRGALLGSVLGARDAPGGLELAEGLWNAEEILAEVDAFVQAVAERRNRLAVERGSDETV
eukprot:CAMPEP_0194344814 /NCGR_PEP_ID=MMETSP0171-20130528/103112_1 /TAXON_ID=218684 /ORGANISM="Corethron pennatum, Strain L29A3" /LENGTH=379 /DNA_ID=CAMNT_0039111639 /DNA_START=74 /DNA_END=1213 /DNA_ORIENTATION=+